MVEQVLRGGIDTSTPARCPSTVRGKVPQHRAKHAPRRGRTAMLPSAAPEARCSACSSKQRSVTSRACCLKAWTCNVMGRVQMQAHRPRALAAARRQRRRRRRRRRRAHARSAAPGIAPGTCLVAQVIQQAHSAVGVPHGQNLVGDGQPGGWRACTRPRRLRFEGPVPQARLLLVRGRGLRGPRALVLHTAHRSDRSA